MYFFIRNPWLLTVWLIVSGTGLASENHIVDHHDPIEIDSTLTLGALVEQTLQQYPDANLLPALQQETRALERRGNSWLADAPSISLSYKDDLVADNTGYHEFEGALELPLWNWGQRSAGQRVAERAKHSNSLREQIIKLRVAGLLRIALWDMKLQSKRHEMSKKIYEISERLLKTVKRRVELGDLPRADLLLAESELLEKRSGLIHAEAEKMHARKRYTTLTKTSHVPVNLHEIQSDIKEINLQHPALKLANARVERKRAEVGWVKSAGSGQATVGIGAKSERESRDGRDIESLAFSLSVPFGGSAHLAPEIAAVNLELTKILAERDHLYRDLEKNLHEAEHILEVGKAELIIVQQRRNIAETHLKMTQLSFKAGEINLMDLLKIQARAFAAFQNASEQAITLERDIALYNQAVGVLP